MRPGRRRTSCLGFPAGCVSIPPRPAPWRRWRGRWPRFIASTRDRTGREYQSWAAPAKRVVPLWSEHGARWEEAFAVLEQPAPAYVGTFLHRDFHLGNVLWSHGRISGVVDWVETSWGPAELDVAHAAACLAMLHGPAAATSFCGSAPRVRYWHVMDIVGYLPDPAKMAQPWRDAGRDVGDDLARRRLEQWLGHVLTW